MLHPVERRLIVQSRIYFSMSASVRICSDQRRKAYNVFLVCLIIPFTVLGTSFSDCDVASNHSNRIRLSDQILKMPDNI